MYKHLLVAVSLDEERDAQGAMKVAERLCEPDGKISVLHVMEQVPGYIAGYMPEGFRSEVRSNTETRIREFVKNSKQANVVVMEGHAARSILDWSNENDVDCIVLASHRPGMQDLLLGSTATHVVRHAKCAVHVLR